MPARWTDLTAEQIAALSAHNRASHVHRFDQGAGKGGRPRKQPAAGKVANPGIGKAEPPAKRKAGLHSALFRLTEHDEQVALIREWDTVIAAQHGIDRLLLWATPNAGSGASRGMAGKMKAEGTRAGVPDLFLAVPRGGYHGLFCEMKSSSGGRTSPAQLAYHDRLRLQGYQVVVCRGRVPALAAIAAYLET